MSLELSSTSNEGIRSGEPSRIDRRLQSARREVRASCSLGSLHWLHWLILSLSLAVTLFIFNGTRTALEEKDQARLDKQVDEVMTLFAERTQRYEDTLWSGTAALHARGDQMDHAGWKAFANQLKIKKRLVNVRISDGDTIMHDELSNAAAQIGQMLTAQRRFEQHGRSWVFDFVTTPEFNQRTLLQHPVLVLLGGIGIDLLLLALFMTLTRSARRMSDSAVELSRLSRQLEVKASKLERSNAELQSFAYVASHDLKTPLLGIDFLTTCLEEDLEDYLADPKANPDVSRNLKRLGTQTHRMNHLIAGVLDYATVGTREEALEQVDAGQLVRDIAGDLRLSATQISIGSNLPVLLTYAVRLEQVFSNLMTNAIKYHDKPDQIQVNVTCRSLEDAYEFSVSDNGPGIDPMFHDRVFEVFQTLQSRDEIESTGVGLSIVRKSVEELGGSVGLTSTPGNGSNFTFTWPKSSPLDDQTEEASI